MALDEPVASVKAVSVNKNEVPIKYENAEAGVQYENTSQYLALSGKTKVMDTGEKVHCDLCDKTFTRKASLQRHITAIHFKNSSDIFKCTNCEYSSQRKTNFKRHILKCHARKELGEATEKRFKCPECSAKFKNKSHLSRHRKKKHNFRQQIELKNRRKCPLCSFDTSDPLLKSIYIHFKNAHNISLKWESYSFGSLGDFYDWKRHIEELTVASYVLTSKSKTATAFKCHRSGIFKSAGKNKRRPKITGTCKINGFCPGSIKIKVKNDCVSALYQPVHVGHELTEVQEIVLQEDSHEDISHEAISHEAIGPRNDFEVKKQVMLCEVSKLDSFLKENCTTTEQVEFTTKTIKQLIATIGAMKSSNSSHANVSPKKPRKTNVVKKRRLIAPRKKKVQKEIFSKDDMQKLSLELLMEGKREVMQPGTSTDHAYCKASSADVSITSDPLTASQETLILPFADSEVEIQTDIQNNQDINPITNEARIYMDEKTTTAEDCVLEPQHQPVDIQTLYVCSKCCRCYIDMSLLKMHSCFLEKSSSLPLLME